MLAELGLTGNAQKRFVQITTLLSLIDPVRGKPIANSLDQHPHDGKQTRERLRKTFLDSFALIYSTSRKGGETASAVYLGNSHPSDTIIRLARNLGVPKGLTNSLQGILDDLAAIASRESSIAKKEPEILRKIIVFNRDKIQSLLRRLQKPEIQDTIKGKTTETKLRGLSLNLAGAGEFVHWIGNLTVLAEIEPRHQSREPDISLDVGVGSQTGLFPASRGSFLQRGRRPTPQDHHHLQAGEICSRSSMLQMAIKQPDVFSSIHIEVIQAPKQKLFSLSEEQRPLLVVIRRLTDDDHGHHIARLG